MAANFPAHAAVLEAALSPPRLQLEPSDFITFKSDNLTSAPVDLDMEIKNTTAVRQVYKRPLLTPLACNYVLAQIQIAICLRGTLIYGILSGICGSYQVGGSKDRIGPAIKVPALMSTLKVFFPQRFLNIKATSYLLQCAHRKNILIYDDKN
ncbi:hypothetical protein DdX_09504 [Ditylenchus destructor]|uniref:Uncharacterized protein n=1 Tax=Ditylenchus destructor TaxID=166010 RepID=A0AAD4R5Y3_9BILA|nr:hypothetical protein DdX_09504 [Ditylenchus destructor]